MKTGVMTVLLFTLSFLSLFSTANAANFPHGFDGRAREIRFDRSERFGGERFGRERAGRESLGREHEVRAHERDARELHSIGRVQPLPYYTSAVGSKR
jgi:hypothetical protein